MLPYGVGVPGVLSVQLDKNFESENKDYGGLYVFQIISLCVFLMFDQIKHAPHLFYLATSLLFKNCIQ